MKKIIPDPGKTVRRRKAPRTAVGTTAPSSKHRAARPEGKPSSTEDGGQPSDDELLDQALQMRRLEAARRLASPWARPHVVKHELRKAIDALSALVDQDAFFQKPRNADGLQELEHERAAHCLTAEFSELAHRVAALALRGHPVFIGEVWRAAMLLVETVHDLSLNHSTAPELQQHASRSLFLPSFRARPKSFEHDFRAVADALRLSADCICRMSDDAAHQLDSPVTRLIAEIVEYIGRMREEVPVHRAVHAAVCAARARLRSDAPAPTDEYAFGPTIASASTDQYLVNVQHFQPEALHYGDLPPLTRATADEWWTKAVRQEVTRRFPDLAGTRLHDLLKGNKPHEKLDDLRRRGKSALRSLSRPAPQEPHPS